MYECELKLLGEFDSLASVYNAVAPDKPSTTHEFDTIYLDDKYETLKKQGFSLRFRPENQHYEANMELKGLQGGTGSVTKRIEVCERKQGASFYQLLQGLKAKVDPKLVTIPSNLTEIFSIRTKRSEKVFEAPQIVLEAALDRVSFRKNHVTLGTDNEFELELKDFPEDFDPEELIALVKPYLSDKVRLSTQSKYSRMLEWLK